MTSTSILLVVLRIEEAIWLVVVHVGHLVLLPRLPAELPTSGQTPAVEFTLQGETSVLIGSHQDLLDVHSWR